MECPTVRIKAATGSYPFTTINESDFDPAKHERYSDVPAADAPVFTVDNPDITPPAADAPAAPAKRGRK